MNGFLLRSALSVGLVFGVAGGALADGNEPPVLESFTVVEVDAGTYSLEGHVSDEFPGECVVWFGGVLAGSFAVCDSGGGFVYYVELGPYDAGQVSAQAFDNLDQASNVEYDVILY